MSLAGQLSDLGDTVSVTASATVIAVWCWRGVNRVSAAAFLACLGLLAAALIGLKLITHDYATPLAAAGTYTFSDGAPSGHAAFAAFIYGSAALLCRRGGRGALTVVAPLLFLAVIAAVSVTRVTLGCHTVADVLAGLTVGFTPVLIFDRVLRAQAVRPTASVSALLAGLSVAVIAVGASGLRLPSTNLL